MSGNRTGNVDPDRRGEPGAPARVVVVGSGFAGLHTCRALERLLPPGAAELTLVSPTDYLLYSPLLPEVAAGAMDPRHIAVPLAQALRRTVPVLGYAVDTDLDRRRVTVRQPDGRTRDVHFDRLVLCPGSVTREFPIPGLDTYARGFKSLAEALYLRDHVLQQLELADTADDPAERAARCTFVVVGGGYAGTEFLAQMQHLVAGLLPRYPNLTGRDVRWLLCDAAPAVLPELGADLGHRALAVLQGRGVQVRLSTELTRIGPEAVTLSDGSEVPTRTVVWTAGVSASPLVAAVADRHGLHLDKGRLTVDAQLVVPGHEHVWALGDAAAVPDLTHPGKVCPPTAQHAQRQAKVVARNVAASLGVGRSRRYKHHDLGLVVDLGGRDAVAKPLGLPLTGLSAKTVTRGYHLLALPAGDNRIRVAADWLLDAALARSAAQLSVVPQGEVTLPAGEHPELYRHPADSSAAPDSTAAGDAATTGPTGRADPHPA
jgi:NADH:quinone reductase (non-electrogenic)